MAASAEGSVDVHSAGLTSEELERFDRDGILLLRGVLSGEEIAAMKYGARGCLGG
jgi:hypothetical protein